MKRIGLILGGLSLAFLLTGCGSDKKLECTITSEQNNVSMKQVYTMNFDSKSKFKSAKLVQDMVLPEGQTDKLETFKTTMESQMKTGQYKDLNTKLTDNGKDTVTLTMDFDEKDLSKLSPGAKTSKDDYKNIKEQLEKGGYTCK